MDQESQERLIVRRPRHEALPDSGCSISLDWIASSRRLEAELGDLSRQGLRLFLDSPLPEDARILLRLEQPANRFSATLPVTVLWSQLQDDGRWAVGCLFDQELSWELMGELFLNGILCTDEIPCDRIPDGV